LGEELLGTTEVAEDFFDPQPGSGDLCLGAGALIEKIGVINGHQRVTLADVLPCDDMDFFDFPADLRLHIDLECRSNLPRKRKDRGNIHALGQDCGRSFIRFQWLSPRHPPHPISEASDEQEQCGEILGHSFKKAEPYGIFLTQIAAAAVLP